MRFVEPDEIDEITRSLKISQAELARQTGVTAAHVTRIKHKQSNASWRYAFVLAAFLTDRGATAIARRIRERLDKAGPEDQSS